MSLLMVGEGNMKTTDALALPSLWKRFGIVLIEAMAAGKPVITEHVSSIPEIVTKGETDSCFHRPIRSP